MRIPGYPPTAPLTDATGWTADPPFWPAFLLHAGAAATAPEAFDADLADLDAYLDRFTDPAAWPVFTAPVAGGTSPQAS
ncbi:hypothetical protein Daura_27055 [Dactylosporangium aurantiacum]|uniref:Uncharacterized protein n=1 Tax=Dactylosporangium aurantiacum TaxID=35754 RepID=A0A9Q9IDB5_9ACTN|nr:hypothetical protein [Dactylosporangium aurantiacum]MDG6106475.1 hypothetical protein [Dactylosporangium aurantiacum]UWZ50490.1 hypothetical protein Daura_27055 [Dactylosporangium aurantiacum]